MKASVIELMVIIVIGLFLVFEQGHGLEGQCAMAERCCMGRDSSCVVNGLQQSTGKFVDEPCYCDEGCLDTGDCCSDYKQICDVQVVECKLSSWSEWSGCDRKCGKGVQSRSRVIVQHPSAGRPPCKPLEQKKGCMGTRCSKRDKYKNPIRETAGLLPARYFEQRYKPDWDVRENLFEHQKSQKYSNHWSINAIEDGYQSDQPMGSFETEPEEYCIVFELSKVTKSCTFDKDFYKMRKGQQMCALCPSDAQRENLGGRCKGHGVEERTTKWRSTFKPKCRGKWRRVREMSECPCLNGPDYVFV